MKTRTFNELTKDQSINHERRKTKRQVKLVLGTVCLSLAMMWVTMSVSAHAGCMTYKLANNFVEPKHFDRCSWTYSSSAEVRRMNWQYTICDNRLYSGVSVYTKYRDQLNKSNPGISKWAWFPLYKDQHELGVWRGYHVEKINGKQVIELIKVRGVYYAENYYEPLPSEYGGRANGIFTLAQRYYAAVDPYEKYVTYTVLEDCGFLSSDVIPHVFQSLPMDSNEHTLLPECQFSCGPDCKFLQ